MNTWKPAFIKERRELKGYLNIRSNVFTVQVTVHWNTQPREFVEFHSLGIFKNSPDRSWPMYFRMTWLEQGGWVRWPFLPDSFSDSVWFCDRNIGDRDGISTADIPSLKVKGEEDGYEIGFLFIMRRKKEKKKKKEKRSRLEWVDAVCMPDTHQ